MHDKLTPILSRARGLLGFAELVAECGGESHALLRRAGISPELLLTPEATLPHHKLVELLEISARALNVSDFGLRLAGKQGISVLGPVALIVQHASTVAEALAAVSRYIQYHSPGASTRLDPAESDRHNGHEEMACWRYELQLPPGAERRQNTELAYAIALRFLALASGAELKHWRIHFAHANGLTPSQYRRHLGCTVRLGQAFDALYFPKTILDAPIDAADPVLLETAQRYVSHVIARSPLDLALQVKTLIVRQLAVGGCTLPRIARQLAMSSGTLQRHLRAQGVSFDEIANHVRKDKALEYLCHTALPLAHIASLLGYVEASSFNRSCRRWFGDTPLKVRRSRPPNN